jgi:hypothetical protein
LAPAGVRAARAALVALAAGDQGIDGDALPRVHVDFHARLDYAPGTLMTHRPRVLDGLCADAAAAVVVDVGTTDADSLDPEQHVTGSHQLRLRRFADGNFLDSSQEGSSHGGYPL